MFDAVIIGGGLSGLTAGAKLALRNKKVLLLEQHNTVGGHAAGFKRKGFFYDAGVINLVYPHVVGYLESLNIKDKVKLAEHTSSFRVKGKSFFVSSLDELFDKFAQVFPEDAAGIRSFFDYLKPAYEIIKLVDVIGDPYSYSGFKRFSRLVKFALKMPKGTLSILKEFSSLKVGDVLDRYFDKDSDFYNYMQFIGCYKGVTFLNFIGMVNFFIKERYPVSGFQGLSDEIAGVILRNGGEIITAAKVKKIEIKNRRAVGVEWEKDGETKTVSCRNVVSAADLKKTFFNLIGRDNLSKVFSDRLGDIKMSETFIILYLGLNVKPEVLRSNLDDNEHLIYCDYIFNPNRDVIDKDFFKRSSFALFSSSLINPEHAPEGKSNLLLIAECPTDDWMKSWGIENGARTDKYKELKVAVTGQLLDRLEKIIPDVADRDNVEVCELGTPFTIERYTGNENGSSSGFTWDQDITFTKESTHGKHFYRYKGLSNLFFCGHQTIFMGGVAGAMGSGSFISKKI